jgi:hypothetical protein
MLSLKQPATMPVTPDRFRGTTQRWTIDTGPLAGTVCDYEFDIAWSLTWRVVAGRDQGSAGRSRRFGVQPVRAQLFLISFPVLDSEMVTATVDFASNRFVGFLTGPDFSFTPVSGTVRVL